MNGTQKLKDQVTLRSKIFRTMLNNALKLMTLYVAKILYQREYCLLVFKSGVSKRRTTNYLSI